MGLMVIVESDYIWYYSTLIKFNIKKNKAVLLINNGIHPGEPDGIDTMQLFRDLALAKIKVPKNTISNIPVYNIGGL
jgi:hypothetical protein